MRDHPSALTSFHPYATKKESRPVGCLVIRWPPGSPLLSLLIPALRCRPKYVRLRDAGSRFRVRKSERRMGFQLYGEGCGATPGLESLYSRELEVSELGTESVTSE